MLTALIVLPLVAAGSLAVIESRHERALRAGGLLATGLIFLAAASVWVRFPVGAVGLQFEQSLPWVPAIGMTYHLGVDGLSVSLVALTAFLFPIALGAAFTQVRDRLKPFLITVLLLEAAMLGMFMAQDLILFYVFWEAMLIPMYFLIGLWGGPARAHAAIKFILYTMAGSVLMLLAIIAVYFQGGRTFDLTSLLVGPLGFGPTAQRVLFLAFAVAFAIKMPVWPLHTWLPDAYAEAPPAVTILLASIMAKAGAYGLLRFCLPFFPGASREFGPLLSILAVIGILYGGAIAWTQDDMRRLLAYGSMSHMGFILLGIFSLNVLGVQGSLVQMINHGVSTGALFLLAGLLLDRTGQARTHEYGGVARVVPALAAVALIVVVSSLALPGTNGFIGEFLILLGTFQARPAYAVFATGGIVVAAAYLLAFVGRVFHGPLREDLSGIADLRAREYAILAPLVLMIFWVGLFPRPFLERSEATVETLLARVTVAAGAAPGTPAPRRSAAAVTSLPRAPTAIDPRPPIGASGRGR